MEDAVNGIAVEIGEFAFNKPYQELTREEKMLCTIRADRIYNIFSGETKECDCHKGISLNTPNSELIKYRTLYDLEMEIRNDEDMDYILQLAGNFLDTVRFKTRLKTIKEVLTLFDDFSLPEIDSTYHLPLQGDEWVMGQDNYQVRVDSSINGLRRSIKKLGDNNA
jgi:hypothetical protein